MHKKQFTVKTEYRQGERIIATVIQEGRAASQRRELFTVGALQWNTSGIDILDSHKGTSIANAMPSRSMDGRVQVSIPATAHIVELRERKPYMSIEFIALEENTTNGGIREITRALLTGAAFVDDPEYVQANTEIRNKKRRWL